MNDLDAAYLPRSPKLASFVETSVSQRIYQVIDLARKLETNAAIVGSPGVGKTFALEAYAHERPYTLYLCLTQASASSMQALLRSLCETLGLYSEGAITAVERRLLKNLPRKTVIIIDEAQNLLDKHLRQLLHLSTEDGGGIMFVFCGNNEVLKRVNVEQGAYAQIGSRVPIHERIGAIQMDDADRIASALGVEGMEAFALTRLVAAKFQARGMVHVIEAARLFCQGSTIHSKDIERAIALLPRFRSATNRKI